VGQCAPPLAPMPASSRMSLLCHDLTAVSLAGRELWWRTKRRFSDGVTGYVLAGAVDGKQLCAMSYSCLDCVITVESGTSDASKCAVSARCVLFLTRYTQHLFTLTHPLCVRQVRLKGF
jgi:hypothetical protein